MKKMIITMILCLSVLAIRGINLETEVNKLHQEITELSGQVQQTPAEITDLKNQQQAINFVSEDLSARVAGAQWRQ